MYSFNNFRDPQASAAEVLRMYWDGSLPVRVDLIAKEMGAQLVPKLGDNYTYSGYFIDASDNPHGVPTIEFNTSDSVNRQRFTIAHELGHMVLGHGTSPRDYPNSFNSGINEPNERSANQFAAEILMPTEAIKIMIDRGYGTSVENLASIFAVSSLALGYRIKNLGMYL